MQNTIQSGMLAYSIKGFFFFLHQEGVEQDGVTQNTDDTIHTVIHMPLLPAVYSSGSQIAV